MKTVGWRVVGHIPGRGNCKGKSPEEWKADLGLKSFPAHMLVEALSRPRMLPNLKQLQRSPHRSPWKPVNP